ncbi:MAG: sialate O-acetylesterase [Chitinophagaceae bacterium]|nr:MAG: sialate O-acetylesterase [Chitinophagaceae bacterium]
MKKTILLPLLSLALSPLMAQVKLPRLVSDSMILQRDEKVKIWGWASAQEKVNVQFNGRNYKTSADRDGHWSVLLPATKAGGPYDIVIRASNKLVIRDILFGDVWFCSGQSNMVHQMNIHDVTYGSEIRTANYPQVRQFLVPPATSFTNPLEDVKEGSWKAATGDNVRPFSAVAFFFARQLAVKYNISVGIINASVGGTPVESWTSEEGLKAFPATLAVINRNRDSGYVQQMQQQARVVARPPADAGIVSSPQWSDPAYLPKGWRNINIPGYWEDQGLKDLNGIVWYRREIDLPPSMASQPATVFLGRIVDADELFINGSPVGKTTYQYPQRRYQVPAGILREGKNIFTIRVTNNSGKGGFVPDKPYQVFSSADTVDLKGTWSYKVGAVWPSVLPGASGAGFNPLYQPVVLYNAMVAPVIPYNIKGICWYQGEANTGQPALYAQLLPALISDWRKKWNKPSLPFLYVQLPGFMDYNYEPSESNWAMLRESQLKTLSVPHTAMAVAIDLGEWNDIHPDNKKDVGERLALAARQSVYGEKLVASGPMLDSASRSGNRITLRFSNTGSGLSTTDGGDPACFAIAGADGRFVWASSKIEGNSIVVWNDAIAEPREVRYAWADNPVNPNLINKESLPASPFRIRL